MPDDSFLNDVVDGVVNRMQAQRDAILERFPMPPGWEALQSTRERQANWNKMSREQRAEWVRQVGGSEVAMRILGRDTL